MKQKDYNKKRFLVFLVVFLFIGMCVIPVTAMKESKNTKTLFLSTNVDENTIYVDDDNTEGPWDGTLEHPYKHIWQGIDVAEDGDTVFVFQGEYRVPQVIINKSISLIGEDRDNTIINQSQHGCSFWIKVEHVTIHNFSIIFDPIIKTAVAYSMIIAESNFSTISNISFFYNNKDMGNMLILQYASWNKVCNNTFTSFTFPQAGAGISMYYSDHNEISNNTIERRGNGIVCHDSSNNVLRDNLISTVFTAGILFHDSHNNIIDHNAITYFGRTGIGGDYFNNNTLVYNTISHMKVGMILSNCASNKILFNTFNHTWQLAFIISASSNNTISFNNFIKSLFFNAFFTNSSDDVWDSNYWERRRILPKPIFGFKVVNGRGVPSFKIDLNPLSEPSVKEIYLNRDKVLDGEEKDILIMQCKTIMSKTRENCKWEKFSCFSS